MLNYWLYAARNTSLVLPKSSLILLFHSKFSILKQSMIAINYYNVAKIFKKSVLLWEVMSQKVRKLKGDKI